MSIMLASQLHISFHIYKSFLLSQTSERVTYIISHYLSDTFASTSVSVKSSARTDSAASLVLPSTAILRGGGQSAGPVLVRMSNAPHTPYICTSNTTIKVQTIIPSGILPQTLKCYTTPPPQHKRALNKEQFEGKPPSYLTGKRRHRVNHSRNYLNN